LSGERRKARGLALQALYEIDCAGHSPVGVMSNLLGEGVLSPDNTAFGRRLVTGVMENLQRIDEQITSFAPAWPISQMALVDRGILRIAIYEMVIEGSSPVGVVINEAVELAKAFGGESSPRFINGVLSSVSHLTSH